MSGGGPSGKPSFRVVYNLARTGAAEFSMCGKYRYLLRRCFDGDVLSEPKRPVLFVMLNPSTADALADDPTIRRCITYARKWGYSDLLVANLFALRATNPKELLTDDDPIGPDNDYVLEAAPRDVITIAAWGSHRAARARALHVETLLRRPLLCLKQTRPGAPPWHPLYLPGDLWPRPLEPATPTAGQTPGGGDR